MAADKKSTPPLPVRDVVRFAPSAEVVGGPGRDVDGVGLDRLTPDESGEAGRVAAGEQPPGDERARHRGEGERTVPRADQETIEPGMRSDLVAELLAQRRAACRAVLMPVRS